MILLTVMKVCHLFTLLIFVTACKHERKVNTTFYYWKTSYHLDQNEDRYLKLFHSKNLYARIMDIDLDENGISPVPVSPIVFKEKLADTLTLVPVVFVVNRVLLHLNKTQLDQLAAQIIYFVNGKVKQAGKSDFPELQIDCDWTASTRENYFYLLKKIRSWLNNIQLLSVTLRLHQLKNQKSSGIPPANRVVLMCYNMGNLRKYGGQNSILDLMELKKYAGENLQTYPLPMDIALPLFNWAVVFRDRQYAGISKRLNWKSLKNKNIFEEKNAHFYVLKTALPGLGLMQGDEIRWEDVTADNLFALTRYLSDYLPIAPLNLIYFHLDDELLQQFKYEELEKTADLLR